MTDERLQESSIKSTVNSLWTTDKRLFSVKTHKVFLKPVQDYKRSVLLVLRPSEEKPRGSLVFRLLVQVETEKEPIAPAKENKPSYKNGDEDEEVQKPFV